MKLRRRKRAKRRGYVLLMFAMLFVCLMGLAALVIDIGFARLAQSQMQTAINSAALEGLRFRDELPLAWQNEATAPAALVAAYAQAGYTFPATTYNPTSAAWQQYADFARRWAASSVTGDEFTDLSGGTVRYGAGPVVNFTGGDTDLAASQLMTPGAPPDYQPTTSGGSAGLEMNYPYNAQNGDMVPGAYGLSSTYSTTVSADEDAAYDRRDFTASSGTAAPAFLVRMRRTPLWNVEDSTDDTPGVSTAGPPLPVLFGRGSLMARTGNGLSVSSGIAVRNTSIAAVGPVSFATSSGSENYIAGLVKTAGPVDPGGTYPGLVPFAINSDIWANLAASGGTLTVNGGTLTMTQNAGTPPDGLVLAPSETGSSLSATSAAAIGQAVLAGSDASALGPYPATFPAYIPIYTTTPLGGQTATIIGFGYLAPGQIVSVTATQIVIAAPSGAQPTYPIAAQNASAALTLPTLAGFSPQDVTTLFQLHRAMANPLYAPVLVNHYIGATTEY